MGRTWPKEFLKAESKTHLDKHVTFRVVKCLALFLDES